MALYTASPSDSAAATDSLAAATGYVAGWLSARPIGTDQGLGWDNPTYSVDTGHQSYSLGVGDDALANPAGKLPEDVVGRAYHFRADDLIGSVADGASVPTWPDRSGNGRDAVAVGTTGQPTLQQANGGFKGRAAVTFDGDAHFDLPTVDLGDDFFMVAVWRRRRTGQTQIIFSQNYTRGTNADGVRSSAFRRFYVTSGTTGGQFRQDPPNAKAQVSLNTNDLLAHVTGVGTRGLPLNLLAWSASLDGAASAPAFSARAPRTFDKTQIGTTVTSTTAEFAAGLELAEVAVLTNVSGVDRLAIVRGLMDRYGAVPEASAVRSSLSGAASDSAPAIDSATGWVGPRSADLRDAAPALDHAGSDFRTLHVRTPFDFAPATDQRPYSFTEDFRGDFRGDAEYKPASSKLFYGVGSGRADYAQLATGQAVFGHARVFYGDVDVSVKVAVGATAPANNFIQLLPITGAGQRVVCQLTAAGGCSLSWDTVWRGDPTNTTLLVVGGAGSVGAITNGTYWMRLQRVGHAMTYSVYSVDPIANPGATPLYTATGTDSNTLGMGFTVNVGVNATSTAQVVSYDDFRVVGTVDSGATWRYATGTQRIPGEDAFGYDVLSAVPTLAAGGMTYNVATSDWALANPDPVDPGTFSNLIYHLRADDLVGTYAEGAAIATWPGRSGTGRDATVTSGHGGPVFIANSFNGHAAARFHPSLDSLMDLPTVPLGKEWTVFNVMRNGAVQQTFFEQAMGTSGKYGNQSRVTMQIRSSGQRDFLWTDGGNAIGAGFWDAPQVSTDQVGSWQFRPLGRGVYEWQMGLNGSHAVVATTLFSGSFLSRGAKTRLGGAVVTDSAAFQSDMAEFIVVGPGLTPKDLLAGELWLRQRYLNQSEAGYTRTTYSKTPSDTAGATDAVASSVTHVPWVEGEYVGPATDTVAVQSVYARASAEVLGGTLSMSSPLLPSYAYRFDASLLTGLSDGDPMSTWQDASGNGHDVTQPASDSRPLYKTGVLGGQPAVRFDGVDDHLLRALVAGENIFPSWTMIVVASLTAINVASRFFSQEKDGTSNGSQFFFGGSTGVLTASIRDDAGHVTSGANSSVVGPAVYGATDIADLIVGSSSAVASRNGADGGTTGAGAGTYTGATSSSDHTYIGAAANAAGPTLSGFMHGDIAVAAAWSPGISTALRKAVERGLCAQYGIAYIGPGTLYDYASAQFVGARASSDTAAATDSPATQSVLARVSSDTATAGDSVTRAYGSFRRAREALRYIADASGNGRVAAVSGTVPLSGGALAAGSYTVSDDPVLVPGGQFTWECFYKVGSISSTQVIMSEGDSRPVISIGSFKINATLLDAASATKSISGTTVLTVGQTYHLALAWDGATAYLFINGALEGSVAMGSILSQALAMAVGAKSSGSFPMGTGATVDSVRLSSTARYTSGFTAPASPLSSDGNTLALWQMDAIVGGSDTLSAFYASQGIYLTSDTAGATDSADRQWVAGRSSADSASSSDSASRFWAAGQAVSDTAGATDAADRSTIVARFVSDTLTQSDDATGSYHTFRWTSDTVGGSTGTTTGHVNFRAEPTTVELDTFAGNATLQAVSLSASIDPVTLTATITDRTTSALLR